MKSYNFFKWVIIQIVVGILNLVLVGVMGKYVFDVSKKGMGPILMIAIPIVLLTIIVFGIWYMNASKDKDIRKTMDINEQTRMIKSYSKKYLLISICLSVLVIIITLVLIYIGFFKRVFTSCYLVTGIISAILMNICMFVSTAAAARKEKEEK